MILLKVFEISQSASQQLIDYVLKKSDNFKMSLLMLQMQNLNINTFISA